MLHGQQPVLHMSLPSVHPWSSATDGSLYDDDDADNDDDDGDDDDDDDNLWQWRRIVQCGAPK